MGCEVTAIAPPTLLPARPEVLGVDHISHNIDEVLPELDVVYMLRIQRERLEGAPYPSLREYNMLYGLTEKRTALCSAYIKYIAKISKLWQCNITCRTL